MTSGGPTGRFRTSSIAWRWTILALGTLWAVGVALFIFGHHINEPSGQLSVTTGGRTFVGNPPALTLYEKDGAVWEIALLLLGLALVAGVADLFVRTIHRSTGPGILAMVAGGLLVLYSLFELVYGQLGIGTVGILVILVGLPMKSELRIELTLGAPTVPT